MAVSVMFFDILALIFLLILLSSPITFFIIDRWGFNRVSDKGY
jgi:hypothetical protein